LLDQPLPGPSGSFGLLAEEIHGSRAFVRRAACARSTFIMSQLSDNPCLSCGACCRTYRVSFYWAEALESKLPDDLTEQVTPHLSCMAGTNSNQPYCAALGRGDAGPMACGVYPQRPSPCREVQIGDNKCKQARARCGLPALA
jgi:Fe-S-cluster containining protein